MVRMPFQSRLDQESKPLPHAPITTMVYSLLNQIGENPEREGLLKTPERFEKAFRELTSGYKITAEDAVGEGIFDAEGPGLISVKSIEFFSLCEHHLLPFWGHASIAYLPNQKILGLSKLARVVEAYSRRLQVQERLTNEIAHAIKSLVDARAVFVKVEAQHMCMMMRGVRKVDSTTRTEFGLNMEEISNSERERMWKAVED